MPSPRRTLPSRSSGAQLPTVAQSGRRLLVAVLLALTVVYLGLFLTSGDRRAEIYSLIGRVYLLLPDEMVKFLWSEWTHAGPPTLLDRAPVFGVAALLLVSAWGAGRLCLPRAATTWLSHLELHLISLAIGLNLWSLYALLLGVCGGLVYPWLFRAPMLVVVLVAVVYAWKSRIAVGSQLTGEQQLSPAVVTRRIVLGLGVLALPLAALYLLTAALPPWEFDVREYHLQVPKEWFQSGRIDFLPHNVYGNMPLGAEMQALLGMLWMRGPWAWWWGALVGKVVLACMTLATALALFAFGRRHGSPVAGAVAAVVYLSIPWVFHVSTVGLIDGAVGFYLWMTFHAVTVGIETLRRPTAAEQEDSPPSPAGGQQLISLAGFLAGAATACKYPSLLFIGAPMMGFVAYKFIRTQPRLVVTCGLLLSLACGPWLVKNALLTGNPVYPLAYGIFGGRSWNPEKDQRWRRGHGPPHNSQQQQFSPRQLLSAFASLGWSQEYQSLLVWPLALFCLLVSNGRRKLCLAIAACLLFYFVAWWLLTHRMDRFFVPALPLAAMLAGIGVTWSNVRLWRWTWLTFVVVGVLLNLLVLSTGQLTGYTAIFVPLQALRIDEFSEDDETAVEHRVDAPHRYLNQHVPPGQRVLLVGDAQPFDLEMPAVYNTCWDDCIFETWMRDRTPQERLATLRENRISHLFFDWLEIARYRSPGNYGFTDYVTPDLVRELVEQGLLRPVSVPAGEGQIDPVHGQMFEVIYE